MEVSATRIRHLIRTYEGIGTGQMTVPEVLNLVGLTKEDTSEDTDSCDAFKEALFIRECSDALQDLTFAAQAGLTFKDMSGLTGYIAKYSRDLRAAIENTVRYHDIVNPAVAFSLQISGNAASLVIEMKDAGFSRFHRQTEFLVFAALSRMRNITQTHFYPLEIRFDHEVRYTADAFRKLAGVPIQFGAERIEIILSLSSLDIPIPTYDLRLRQHLTAYADRLLAERQIHPQNLRGRVEGQLMSSLPGRLPAADEVAGNLGMSTRTFARRLTDEDLSYRAIVDDMRFDLSKTFMKDGMSLSEISFALGYSEQAAFSTAFRRWAGQPPRAFRQAIMHRSP